MMQVNTTLTNAEKKALYDLCLRQVIDVLREETDPVAMMASVACILKMNLPHAFWVGFYRVDPNLPQELVIGPYQGTFGCLRIPFTQGICGYCATTGETVMVGNVHQFTGHIACDSRSKSEIVVPVFNCDHQLYAVLDVDAEEYDAFSDDDRRGLEAIAETLADKL